MFTVSAVDFLASCHVMLGLLSGRFQSVQALFVDATFVCFSVLDHFIALVFFLVGLLQSVSRGHLQ